MKNISAFISLPLLAGFGFFVISAGAPSSLKRPNVLVILVDEWRAQSAGYSGEKDVITPNLDQFAAGSANLVNAVSGMPVCTPFRASFMTGQRPLTNGIFMNDVQLDTNATSIAKVFAKNGYATGFIGKWHLDGQYRLNYTPPGARRQGFKYWKAVNCDHDYNNDVYYDNDDTSRHHWPGYDVFAQTDDAVNYIQEHAGKADPFFLVLSLAPPHDPYHTAPEQFRKMYDPASLSLRPNVPKEIAASVRRDLAGYYAHMTAIDFALGKLLNSLKEQHLLDNIIVLFTSDHGDLLGSQGAYFKQRPYDESIKVPMLFHASAANGIKQGRYNAMINSEDIMPTLLGLCKLPIPTTVEGVDFSSYLGGNVKDPKDTVALLSCVQPFGQWTRGMGGKEYRGIRTPHYTYVCDLNGPWLLFDNERDPYQQKNLVNMTDFTTLRARLDKILKLKLKQSGDRFLPGAYYVKKFNYPALNARETVPYYNVYY